MTTTTILLEQQIVALLHQLEETKEAERLEAAQKEAEAMEEEQRRLQAKAEEQRRLQAKAEAEAEHVRRDARIGSSSLHRIKVSIVDLETPFIDSLVDRKIPLLSPLPGAKDPVLHQRWSSGLAETAMGGGPW